MPQDNKIESWRPKLEPAAKAAIKELEASTGRQVAPVNVLWLQSAASELARPDRESPKLCDLPLAVGGALLWPLSYFAAEWFENVASKAYGMDKRVVAFTLAHSFDRDTLQRLATQAQVKDAVNAWLDTLLCAPAALEAAVDRMVGQDELMHVENPAPVADAVARASDWGDIVALLCSKYHGTDPLFWACRCSIDYCAEMAIRAASELPPDKQPNLNSVARFHSVVAHIKAEMLAENEKAVA